MAVAIVAQRPRPERLFFLVATLVTVRSQPLAPVIINAGGDDTCAVLEDRTTKCWGNNANGHLGLGDTENRGDQPGEMGNNLPVVDFGTGRYVVALSSGYNHRCAILDNGALKCWGQGHKGQLGYEDDRTRGLQPGEMGDNLPEVNLGTGLRAVKIASGDYHQCAVLNNSKLKCWGEGEQGQIGDQTPDDRGHAPGQMGDNLPYVDLGAGRTVLDVTCGDYHTCVVMENGAVKCFGAASQGQLGYEDREERGKGDKPDQMGDFLPEVNLGTGRTAIKVAAGFYHTCALLDDYTVKCWGYGGAGQLGQESNRNIGTEVGEMGDVLPAIDLGTGRTALDINTGATFTCALLDNYLVKCWGENHDGELGTGDTRSRGKTAGTMGDSLPPIDFGGSGAPVMITSGDKHSCAVLSDGFTKCWGLGKDGQLGFENDQTYGATPETLGERLPWVDFGATSTSSTTTSTTTASTSTRSTSTLTTVTSTTTTVTTVSTTITSTTPIQSTTTAVTQDTTTAVTQDTTAAVTLDTTNPSPDAGSGSVDQTTSTQAVALVDGATTLATDATLSVATTTTLALAAATSTPVDGTAPSTPPADSGVTTTASGSTVTPSPDVATGTGAAETTVAALPIDSGALGTTTLASSGSPLGQSITTTTPVTEAGTGAPTDNAAGAATTPSPGDGVSLSGTTPVASAGAGTGADAPADPGAADPGAGTGTDTGADTGTGTGGGGSNSSAVGDASGGAAAGGSAGGSTSGGSTDSSTTSWMGADDGVSLLPAPGATTTPNPSGSQGESSATAPPASDGSGGSAFGSDAGGSDAGGSDAGGSDAGGSDAGGSDAGGSDAGSASGTTVGLATPPAAQPAGTSTTTTLGPTTIAPGATATPGDTYPAAGAGVADSDLGFTPVLGLNPPRIMVQAVQRESWGGRASIAAGDQLLSINGMPVANMTPDEIFGLLGARPLNLTFTRGNGQPPAVAWTLAELRGCRLYEANAGQQDTQLGLSTSIVNGNLTVAGVQAGLWAELSQLVPGDLLLALNGKKASEMAPSDTTQLLQITRPLTLSLLRCGLTTTSWPSGPTTTSAMGPTGAPGDTPPTDGQTTPDVTLVAGPTPSSDANAGVSTTSGVASSDGTTTLGFLPAIEAQAQFSDTQLGLSWTGTPPAPVRLTAVDAGMWGARVGMAEGDVLVTINGQPVNSMTEDNVSSTLQTTRPLTLKFAPSISLDPSKQRYTAVAAGADVTLGFQPVGEPPKPVLVTQVQPGSWADRSGLKEGDQILAVNGASEFGMSATELRSSLLQMRPLTLMLLRSPSQGQSTTGPGGAGAGMPMWATTNTTTIGEPWFQAELLAKAGRQGVWHTLALTLAMVLLPLLTC